LFHKIIKTLNFSKMKTKIKLTFAILFIALISGCAKDDFVEVDGLCPEVLSTFKWIY
jgi:hypothetical protein